jgi:transcription-repair coupling factor (superfamily II helicase)
MAQALTGTDVEVRLQELADRLQRHPGFTDVLASLKAGQTSAVDGVWGAARALLAVALARHAPGPVVVVCPHAAEIDPLADDVLLFGHVAAQRFPAWETQTGEQVLHDEIYADRLRLLKDLAGTDPPPIVVASIQSLLQPVPSPDVMAKGTRPLAVGQRVDLPELLAALTEHSYHSMSAVQLPGEFAVRGGIVDIFAPDWNVPVRIELFGDEIESLRNFDIATQRSLETLDAVDVTLIGLTQDGPGGTSVGHDEHLAAFLPEASWLLLVEPNELDHSGRNYLGRVEHPETFHTVRETFRRLAPFATVTADGIASGAAPVTCQLAIESIERFRGGMSAVREQLETVSGDDDVLIVSETEAESKRLGEVFAGSPLVTEGRLQLSTGRLSAGFRMVAERTIVINSAELFQRAELPRTARRHLGRVIDSFLALREGDLVVHLAHGIGRYRGLILLGEEGQAEEHLQLEFRGGTKIYVPANKIDLVQKYVGGSKKRPSLAKIGGTAWAKQKVAAEQAVTDLAAEMLELQAARAARPGLTFPEDSTWQEEFDASFPYRETDDQEVALEAIKRDMQTARPMDRLLCGDVGFGKTELAIRAAFKAVDAGYQVAVLVPTTILAEQHRRTFEGRMAEFPFEIATLSRFATRKEQTETIKRLRHGSVDIVIGTHRLVQADVQFQNLGLVIIDEEQRFGVAVKQRIKAYRHTVDVLTMTATPIPRTLHMSLLGIRSISNLETPPEDRLAIETRVTRWDDALIRHAILRELSRDGQIFFVHNRVNDIQAIAAQLQSIVPEARIEVAHGQLPEGKLERVMLRFLDYRFDLLVATTIVESGLDIPNANTIFIDEADRYGLADLHQLRGRVGRYKHRAYCYLLLDQKKHLTTVAAQRLRAIEEFSAMGAGFNIAMRDLELRGAGNILGTQQSGHIATVGYELYCALLEKAVRRLKQLPASETVEVHIDLPGQAYLPTDYIPDMRTKIDLYRRLTRITTEAELDDFEAELADRFGPRPAEAERAIWFARMRIRAHRHQIVAVHREDRYLVLNYRSRSALEPVERQSQGKLRVADAQSAYLPLGAQFGTPADPAEALESLLQPT